MIINQENNFTKKAVLSRFKETDNNWYDLLSSAYDEVIVYNKFEGENLLPNIGRESHTYLHYIIENYEDLPDEILFSQYSPWDHFHAKTIFALRDDGHVRLFLDSYLFDFVGIRAIDYDSIVRGRHIKWSKFTKELFGYVNIDILKRMVSSAATLNGVFRVTKTAVLKHPIEFYKRGLDMLARGVHTNEGYYFERIWRTMFTNYGSVGNHPWIADSIFLFGNDLTEKNTKTRKSNAYGHIKFSSDGTICNNGISFYHHPNESYWSVVADNLIVFNSFGGVTAIYNLSGMNQYDVRKEIRGDFYAGIDDIRKDFFWLKSLLWAYKEAHVL